MSWRDNFTGKGKFRNAEFLVKSDETIFGRRKQVHEYPLRDEPYIEDLGKKGREFTIDAYVIGPDYMAARDKLMDEIEKPGAGVLVHPYYGTLRVSILDSRISQSTSEGGQARFTLKCLIGTENIYPADTLDTQAAVDAAADKSLADSINDFADNFTVLELADDMVTEVANELDNTITAINNVAGAAAGPVSSLIRTPYNLGSALAGAVTQISTIVTEPLRAINLYKSLFSSSSNSPAIPETTPGRKKQAASVDSIHALVQRAAVIEASRSSSQANYDSYDDAVSVRDTLMEELDRQMELDTTSDIIYQSLLTLRTPMINDLRLRGENLARLRRYTPATTLPALVLAHNLYGDTTRESELISRNNIAHPGFVAGGQSLEVLSD